MGVVRAGSTDAALHHVGAAPGFDGADRGTGALRGPEGPVIAQLETAWVVHPTAIDEPCDLQGPVLALGQFERLVLGQECARESLDLLLGHLRRHLALARLTADLLGHLLDGARLDQGVEQHGLRHGFGCDGTEASASALNDDRQPVVGGNGERRVVVDGVAAFGPAEHTSGLQRRVLDRIPAQAVAQETGRAHPQRRGRLIGGHLLNGSTGQDPLTAHFSVVGEHLGELGHVSGCGHEATGCEQVGDLDGLDLSPLDDRGDSSRCRYRRLVARVPHAQWLEDVVGHVVLELHAGDPLHHHSCQREAVVAVHIHRTRRRLQRGVTQPRKGAIDVRGDRFVTPGVGVVRARQSC